MMVQDQKLATDDYLKFFLLDSNLHANPFQAMLQNQTLIA
jgi:hypothetical protein